MWIVFIFAKCIDVFTQLYVANMCKTHNCRKTPRKHGDKKEVYAMVYIVDVPLLARRSGMSINKIN